MDDPKGLVAEGIWDDAAVEAAAPPVSLVLVDVVEVVVGHGYLGIWLSTKSIAPFKSSRWHPKVNTPSFPKSSFTFFKKKGSSLVAKLCKVNSIILQSKFPKK